MNDYPQVAAAVDRREPVPRRVRAVLGGRTVLDTTRALYVWEWPPYPQFYIPVDDADAGVLVDEDHEQKLIRTPGGLHPDLAWSYSFPTAALTPIAGLVAFYNEKVDISLDGRPLDRPETHFFPK